MDETDITSLCEWQGPMLSNCSVRIKIPMHDKEPDTLRSILDAEETLRGLGIAFDAGLGGGFRDWEFDWSLTGAVVRVKAMFCLKCWKYLPSGTWPCAVLDSGAMRSYCCKECRAVELAEKGQGEAICLDLPLFSGPDPQAALNKEDTNV